MTMTPNSWAGVCLVFVLLQACAGSSFTCLFDVLCTETDHQHLIAYMHSCRVSDYCCILARRCVFFCLSLYRGLPAVLATLKGLLPPLLCSCHRTCCDGRLWQLFIRVICSHLAHDGLPWSSDLPSFSLPLSPPVRLNGNHVLPGCGVNV